MRTSLRYLPKNKQEELKQITAIIRKEFKPEMIILFGSYARGDYVDSDISRENGYTVEYQSDYDILVIASNAKKAYRSTRQSEHFVKKKIASEALIQTPISIIAHSIDFVNNAISNDRSYFFIDIKKEGKLLYDSGKVKLARKRRLKSDEVYHIAKGHFEAWFKNGDDCLLGYGFYAQKNILNKAAFELHQATEAFYTALILVFTEYRPKTHDLKKMRDKTLVFDKALKTVFSCKTKKKEEAFDLLNRAYVEARYKKDYKITLLQLRALKKEIDLLKKLTEQICLNKLQSLSESGIKKL